MEWLLFATCVSKAEIHDIVTEVYTTKNQCTISGEKYMKDNETKFENICELKYICIEVEKK